MGPSSHMTLGGGMGPAAPDHIYIYIYIYICNNATYKYSLAKLRPAGVVPHQRNTF